MLITEGYFLSNIESMLLAHNELRYIIVETLIIKFLAQRISYSALFVTFHCWEDIR